MGRKSADSELESRLTLIISMLKDNLTDKEIAENLGISLSTWRRKKSQNPKIKEVIEEITDLRNQEVEEALFKCCKGFHYLEEVVTKVKEEIETESGNIIVKEDVKISTVKKYKAPDVTAQKYWLNNRKRAAWKDDPNKVELDKKSLRLKEKEVNSKVLVMY